MAITTQQYLEQLQLDKKNILSSLSDLGVDVPENATFTDVPGLVRASQNVVEVESKDVNYYDFDGTILYSYTKEEFLSLTEHPPLKTKPGFTPQEWNWTFEEAYSYVQDTGLCDIGMNCRTEDNKTRIKINITNEFFMEPTLGLSQSVARAFEVDWGDGSPTEISDNATSDHNAYDLYLNLTHKYEKTGEYVITLTRLIDGAFLHFNGNGSAFATILRSTTDSKASQVYRNYIMHLELGNYVKFLASALQRCNNLLTVNLPAELTGALCYSAVNTATSLKAYMVPHNNLTMLNYVFEGKPGIEYLSIPPVSITNSTGAHPKAMNLKRFCTPPTYHFDVTSNPLEQVAIPSSVTTLKSFTGSNLSNLKIPEYFTELPEYFFQQSKILRWDMPNHITKAGPRVASSCPNLTYVNTSEALESIPDYAFYESSILTYIILHEGLKSIGEAAFRGTNISEITIPSTCTTFGKTCFYGLKLTSIEIPEGTTVIPSSMLSNTSLKTFAMPSTVTEIQSSAFQFVTSMTEMDLTKLKQVPILSNTSAFTNCNAKLHVSTELYDGFTTATNWNTLLTKFRAFDSEGNLKVRLNISNATLLDETPVPLTLSLTDSEGNSIEITESETYAGQAWLSPGTYTLTASAEGYETKEFTITAVDKGLTQSITLVASEGIDEGVDIT